MDFNLDDFLNNNKTTSPSDNKGIDDTFEELRSQPEGVIIKEVEPVAISNQDAVKFLLDLDKNKFTLLYQKHMEEGLFPTLASMGTDVIVAGWGLNEKLAEDVLIKRHSKEHPTNRPARTPAYYEPDKAVTDAKESIKADSPEEELRLRKALIITTIEEYADNPRLSKVLKDYALMVDYDLDLCKPILNKEPHFYTRMEEVDLYDAIVARKTISLLSEINQKQTYLLEGQNDYIKAIIKLHDALISIVNELKLVVESIKK